jgi:hypothetical protein
MNVIYCGDDNQKRVIIPGNFESFYKWARDRRALLTILLFVNFFTYTDSERKVRLTDLQKSRQVQNIMAVLEHVLTPQAIEYLLLNEQKSVQERFKAFMDMP